MASQRRAPAAALLLAAVALCVCAARVATADGDDCSITATANGTAATYSLEYFPVGVVNATIGTWPVKFALSPCTPTVFSNGTVELPAAFAVFYPDARVVGAMAVPFTRRTGPLMRVGNDTVATFETSATDNWATSVQVTFRCQPLLSVPMVRDAAQDAGGNFTLTVASEVVCGNYQPSTATPPSKLKVGAIVGIVVGAVAIAVLIIIVFRWRAQAEAEHQYVSVAGGPQ